jgi:hypothetical protein
MGNFLFGTAQVLVGIAVLYFSFKYVYAHAFVAFLLVAAYLAYMAGTVYVSSQSDAGTLKKMDIRGKFVDPVTHALNVFEWSDLTHVTRAQQGTAETQVWTLDEVHQRYVVNVSTTIVQYATYDSTTGIITITNSLGQTLAQLTRISDLTSASCAACANASTGYPTYANFAEHFHLVSINPVDQPLLVSRLDVMRGCAMFHLDTIPTGVTSNELIANSPLAVAKDQTCFFYIPPTQYTFLLGNGIVQQQVALSELPSAFCGSM